MSYPGGKGSSGVVQEIVNQIPPHQIYIEGFLGSGTVLRAKRPADSSIGIDSDAAVVKKWAADNTENSDASDKWVLPPGATIINGDVIMFLSGYSWTGTEFIYLDPPYLFDLRASKRQIYNSEFGDVDEHKRLLDCILSLHVPVAISGYWSELYAEKLSNWRHITYNTMTRSGSRQEFLWMNYPEPTELHDYKYLGSNFRQRERLNRMRNRWVARLKRMGLLERQMLSAAIAEIGEPR